MIVWCILFLLNTSAANTLPNFVIFLADDLGIGDVGCFGNNTIKTPNIDSIAVSGIKLTHHKAAAAVCTPSRAALLTGRYPVRSGMESIDRNKVFLFVASSGGLPQSEVTIAKALKQKEYATAIVGKWHLGNDCNRKGDMCHHPLRHGFDHFYGIPLTNLREFGDDGRSVIVGYIPNIYKYIAACCICGLSTAFFIYRKSKIFFTIIFLLTVFLPTLFFAFLLNIKTLNGILMRDSDIVEQPLKLVGLTQRFAQEAVEFIENCVKDGTPFFLYMPFVHVHTALFTTSRFSGISQHGRYGDNIEEMDWAIGEVLRSLRQNNIINNTFLYFSSDNGGHVEEEAIDGQREGGFNGLYKGGKATAGFEGGIRVPSIISLPNSFKANGEVSSLTSQMDILPTIMDLAGIALPQDRIIDGKTLLPLLKGEQSRSSHKILFHYCGIYIHAATYIPNNGNNVWKIHWASPTFLQGTTRCEFICHCFAKYAVQYDPPLLYDLVKDPFESNNLNISLSPEHQQIILEAELLRNSHVASVEKTPSQFSLSNSIWKPWLQPCCNFPTCSCQDHKYLGKL